MIVYGSKMHNGAKMERKGSKLLPPTCGFVFRVGFDCAFSSSDSDALERRLGSGLLLRHPQVSNQNSKERTHNQSDEKWSTPGPRKSHLKPSSFLFWSTLFSLAPASDLSNPHPNFVLYSSTSPSTSSSSSNPTEQRALLIRAS